MIEIDPAHLDIVQKILKKHLPKETTVWIFGSRARGKCKPYSDLDIAIELNDKPIAIKILADISYDFEESDLPYKVDIVDWNAIDKTFQKNIQQDLNILLQTHGKLQ